ncbi:MAG: hypothetical protein P8L18_16190 [Verrucomicrobiota bacterium]|jgi:hypothetical protein|nr:hypothetical protein [Verrucomicrobiota bacterium]
MSLKAFHIIFVLVTTLLFLFVGIWSLGQYRQVDATGFNLLSTIASFTLFLVTPVYGYFFLKKLKHISFL